MLTINNHEKAINGPIVYALTGQHRFSISDMLEFYDVYRTYLRIDEIDRWGAGTGGKLGDIKLKKIVPFNLSRQEDDFYELTNLDTASRSYLKLSDILDVRKFIEIVGERALKQL